MRSMRRREPRNDFADSPHSICLALMPRHAGFGAVATVGEATINDAVVSYARQLGPFFWPLPNSVPLGGPAVVNLAGVVEMLPPSIELHPDPNDRITAHFTFRSTLRAAPSGQRMKKKWTIQLNATVQAGVVTTIEDGRIVLGIDTASVSFAPFQVKVIAGSPLPSLIREALESGDVASAATAFVRSLPPLTIAPPILQSELTRAQPLDLPWTFATNWFTVALRVTRIVVKPLEHALTLAVDFQTFLPDWPELADRDDFPKEPIQLTNGDENQLVDLTTVGGSGVMYRYKITPDTEPNLAAKTFKDKDGNTVVEWVDLGPPKLTAKPEPAGGDIAFALNTSVLSQVTKKQISPQVSDTMIYPDIILQTVGLRYAIFYKELVGTQHGLAIDFHVTVQKGPWFGVDGTIYLQAYLQYPDGPTEFVYQLPDTWRFYIGDVEVDLPIWVDVAVAVLAITFSIGFPLLSGMIVGMAAALIADVIPGLVENIESQAQNGMNSGANTMGIPAATGNPLPGLTAPIWNSGIKYLCVTPESVDLAINTAPDHNLLNDPVATISPTSWPAALKQSIRMTLTLRDDLEELGANITVKWSVRRGDNWKVVATATKAYNDPAGNGVLIPHHSQELYFVDKFLVRCTVELTLDGQTGEIWTDVQGVSISDYIDRHHKYVEWGPHVVHFKNEGTGDHWWQHTRRSRIHRTAVSARCRMLQQVAKEHAAAFTDPAYHLFTNVTYKDVLPFSWAHLNNHRKPLCEYCFFGGPEKTTSLPEEDWF